MRRKFFPILAGALALAANAHAGIILIDFSEVIVFETDTFETSGGATLFTSSGVGYGDWLSPNIAADLAGDPTVPNQIRSTASLVSTATEYQFLAGQGPNYLVLGGTGPAELDLFTDQIIGVDVGSALAAAGPGYSVVGGNSPQPVVNVSYTTGAIEPDGSLIDGTVTFDIVQESIVEQPTAAVPEPSTLALTVCGSLALWRLRIQRRSRRWR